MQKNAYLVLTGGVLAVSFAAVFIKIAEAPALVIASYRMLLAFMILLPISVFRYPAVLRSISSQDKLLMALSGAFLALHFATWISAFNYTTVASATVLDTTQPVFVVLFSYLLFREKTTRRQLAAVLLAIAGGVIIGVSDLASATSQASLWGNLLALGGAIFAALYFLCGKSVRQRVPVEPYATFTYGASAAFLLCLTLANKLPLWPYPTSSWLMFAGLAIVCTVLGHSSLNWALEFLPTAAVGISVLGEPIGASLWALFLFKETPSPGQMLGAALLLIGIFIFMFPSQSKPLAAAG